MKKLLHLKSGISCLENNTILVCGEFSNRSEFAGYNRIVVDEDECYAANSLWINGTVLVPEGFPDTRKKIEKAGYETIIIDVSEFRKLDGGLSCLPFVSDAVIIIFPVFSCLDNQINNKHIPDASRICPV